MDNNDPNNPNQNFATGTPSQPAQPAQPAPATLPESPWPSSTNITDPAMNAPVPQPPGTTNPFASNPFLQPQIPLPTPPMPENPFPSISPQTPQEDPLNTAFAPAPNPNETNLFNSTIAHTEAPAGAIPEIPIQPAQPTSPSSDFLNPAGAQAPTPPQNPVVDMALGGVTNQGSEMTNPVPPQTPYNPQIPGSNQPGTLDLSSLQTGTAPAPDGTSAQPGNQLPEMGPVENAPTDLSHLIAGDETNQQPGDIYNPPVASDQNPALNTTQPQVPSEDGTPPAEKHLNLTKVLLVAGIPIILIVAALSAYIFLGVGKSSPKSTAKQTSLPVEQTKPAQAPLTNPPQQIVAPSANVIPAPSATTAGPESTSSGTALPSASSSPTQPIL